MTTHTRAYLLTRRLLAAAAIMGVAVTLIGAQTGSAHTTVRALAGSGYHRCGFTNSPYGPLGIYIIHGHTSCTEGKFLIHRMFHVTGEHTGAGDTERYPDGWYCGGQMGYFYCARPQSLHPREAVQALECNDRLVRCPAISKIG